MKITEIPEVIKILKGECARLKTPYVTEVAGGSAEDGVQGKGDGAIIKKPFKVLVSCILSLRTKDEVTMAASKRLFALAATPLALADLGEEKIEEAIYPAGFYRTKARTLKALAWDLLENHGGRVPDTMEGLLALKGVGRKTANLVLTMGYGKPGICVDTHVHRIVNRWGLVETKTPDKTEAALRKVLPKRYWIGINDLLVRYGQNVCRPLSPFCSSCAIAGYCEKKGVKKSR